MFVWFAFNTNWLVWNHLEIWCWLELNFWFSKIHIMDVTTILVSSATVWCETVYYFWIIINIHVQQQVYQNRALRNTTLYNFPTTEPPHSHASQHSFIREPLLQIHAWLHSICFSQPICLHCYCLVFFKQNGMTMT